nr:putative reverse transcriptase domain-containing protein [Tanacetum cinerariifolium]
MEDQPLPTNASPIALLPGYINKSNPDEDEEDPEEDPVDYPANGGDNDDNEVHHTFHVSNLKKCYSDEPLVMSLEGVHIDDTLQFMEEPVEIMEREIKRLKFPCYDKYGESHETFQCQPIAQNIDFSGSDKIQTPQYPEIHFSSQETSDEVFQSNHSIQNKESFENPSNEIAVSNSNQEKEEPSQEFDIHQLIEECSTEVREKQKMEDTMLELVKICQEKEFLCIHDDIDDLIESALNSKLLLIKSNSQHLDKKEQEVKNVIDECEVALEDKKECDLPIYENSPICDNHSDTFSDSKINDDISVYDNDFEDIEYVEATLSDHENVIIEEGNSVEEENVVQQEEEEIDLEG